MKELVIQNGQYLVRDVRSFSGGKRSGCVISWLKKDGTWAAEYKDAARFQSEREADSALIRIVKKYE